MHPPLTGQVSIQLVQTPIHYFHSPATLHLWPGVNSNQCPPHPPTLVTPGVCMIYITTKWTSALLSHLSLPSPLPSCLQQKTSITTIKKVLCHTSLIDINTPLWSFSARLQHFLQVSIYSTSPLLLCLVFPCQTLVFFWTSPLPSCHSLPDITSD